MAMLNDELSVLIDGVEEDYIGFGMEAIFELIGDVLEFFIAKYP